jgi:hypothetical protein
MCTMLYVLTGTRHTRSHLSRAYRSRVCARSRALRSSSLATCETLTPFAAANKSARCSAGAAPSPRTRLHTTLDDTRGVQHTRDLVLRARTARCTHTHTHTHTHSETKSGLQTVVSPSFLRYSEHVMFRSVQRMPGCGSLQQSPYLHVHDMHVAVRGRAYHRASLQSARIVCTQV